jgi:hypothetical protein
MAEHTGVSEHAAASRDVGIGPFPRLILRNLTVIDGTGAPAYGPADIVIENNRIALVHLVGPPTGPRLQPAQRPEAGPGGHEIDLAGHYALPGFIDAHGHIGWPGHVPSAQYVYDLWLAHGITTVRDPGCFINGLDFVRDEADRSARNDIAAPRISPYVGFGEGHPAPFQTPADACAWVGEVAGRGAEGIKFFGYRADIYQAALREANQLGLGSACHHHQGYTAQATALDSARWGLSSIEHFYGLPEAMLAQGRLHRYPLDYNYQNEVQRFADAGTVWAQAAEPGSRQWNDLLDELVSTSVVLDPTLNVYIGLRDAARVQNSEWHHDYTAPQLWSYWQPDSGAHGSFFEDWGTEQEIVWRDNFRRWMLFVKAYVDRGGHVTVGTDPGSIFKLFGFGFPEEMELLRECGLDPLEVVRAATLWGAQLLGWSDRLCSIEAGKLADLCIVAENPLANLKVLYGHGRLKLNDGRLERVGGVVHTVKDGIVYDAARLRARVQEVVAAERERTH